jgi:hypothetical protein
VTFSQGGRATANCLHAERNSRRTEQPQNCTAARLHARTRFPAHSICFNLFGNSRRPGVTTHAPLARSNRTTAVTNKKEFPDIASRQPPRSRRITLVPFCGCVHFCGCSVLRGAVRQFSSSVARDDRNHSARQNPRTFRKTSHRGASVLIPSNRYSTAASANSIAISARP